VDLTVAQFRKFLQGTSAKIVVLREHAEGYQYFVGVQSWVLTT
jgi:hypothetical protein